jgi:hypothetical protein
MYESLYVMLVGAIGISVDNGAPIGVATTVAGASTGTVVAVGRVVAMLVATVTTETVVAGMRVTSPDVVVASAVICSAALTAGVDVGAASAIVLFVLSTRDCRFPTVSIASSNAWVTSPLYLLTRPCARFLSRYLDKGGVFGLVLNPTLPLVINFFDGSARHDFGDEQGSI